MLKLHEIQISVCINKVLLGHSYLHLCIVSGCFQSYNVKVKPYGMQKLKCLVSGLYHEKICRPLP